MEDKKVNQGISNTVNEQVRKLESLFPSVVKDGEVDFEALKEELGKFAEVDSEKYELTWAGKKRAKKIAKEDVVGRTLKYIPEESKNADTTENLYIEGDNLEVLKLLRQNYYGMIKMIYIDPPYNTGNDFIYKDSFTMSSSEADIADGSRDELGERYVINYSSQNRFHANWLNMLYPRLLISKDFLHDKGVIFISIDDNEMSDLKKICDEIFGESNFIAEFVVASNSTKNNSKYVSISHEYILCYAKNKANLQEEWKVKKNNVDEYYSRAMQLVKKGLDQETIHEELLTLVKYPRFYDLDHYTYADEKGIYQTDNPGGVSNGNIESEIIHPVTKKACAKPNGGWRYKEDELRRMEREGLLAFGADETVVPRVKRYLSDYIYQVPKSVLFFDSQGSTKWLKSNRIPFDFAKAVELMKYIISISDEDAIVLDYFSGSASTAHGVFRQNIEDNGRRKFILVQLPEICEDKCETSTKAYNNICEIGKERIRIAGDIIKQENIDADIDVGFKVFRVADTNIKWNSLMDEGQIDLTQIEMTPDQLDFMPGANDVDIVYELMLRQRDVPLSESLDQLSDIGDRTYLYAGSFLVCLETEITEKLIGKLAELDPLPIKFIFRDSAFRDDIALKDETFRRLKALVEKNAGTNKPAYTVEFI
ncbi:MAG: site-specific DNA-methyltransferase [Lachnospiraceae bacterium]|nr:site-specific DNA-methyltransferase [Lachnospiraceae bacterium]